MFSQSRGHRCSVLGLAGIGGNNFEVDGNDLGCITLGSPVHAMENGVVNLRFTFTVSLGQHVYEAGPVSEVSRRPRSRIVQPGMDVGLFTNLDARRFDEAQPTFASSG